NTSNPSSASSAPLPDNRASHGALRDSLHDLSDAPRPLDVETPGAVSGSGGFEEGARRVRFLGGENTACLWLRLAHIPGDDAARRAALALGSRWLPRPSRRRHGDRPNIRGKPDGNGPRRDHRLVRHRPGSGGVALALSQTWR